MQAYLTQIRTNLLLTMRDRTVLFFNYLFPLLFFFIFGFMMHAEQGGSVQLVTMVLTIGILGSGFFGAGMRTVMDREANILRRFKVAPITAAPILVSQIVVGVIHYIPVTVLVLALAHFVYGMPPLEHPVSLFTFVLIGVGRVSRDGQHHRLRRRTRWRKVRSSFRSSIFRCSFLATRPFRFR